MADTGSALLNSMTPEEAAAIRRIAQARAAFPGMGDQEIYDMLGYQQAGGYGFIDPALQAAQIATSYNTARGNLALNAEDAYYNRMNNPYNVVSATQFARDTGAPGYLTDPNIANVPASPAAGYSKYINSILFPPGEAGASGGSPASAASSPASGGTANPLAGLGALANLTPEQAAAVRGINANREAQQGAQGAAARMVGGGLRGVGIGAQAAGSLAAGQVPGNAAFSERNFGLMSPDQQSQIFGLQASTGRVSDPMKAYQAYINTYGHR